MENDNEIKTDGSLPLDKSHICFEHGHAMFSVYSLLNYQSSWGMNKCGRCGWEDHWQYDFVGSNPMFYNS